MVFATGYSGVYALNATNGKIVWHYIANNTYNEEPYSSNVAPNGSIYSSYTFGSTGPIIGGGIVFAPNTEHSPTFVYRGQEIHAIDAFTGNKIWSIKGFHTPTAIAYGTLITRDTYNGFTYAFGKGSTETTISVQNDVISKGSSVLLKGTVLDTSSAQKGTPAISDASMTSWMEYLHMQQPKPTNATGVKIHLTALDSNGNTEEIGAVTSDVEGNFKALWTPPIEGAYTVYATFTGSESYYGSSAETVLGVSPSVSPIVVTSAPTQTTAPTQTPVQSTSPSPSAIIIPPTSDTTTTTYVALGSALIVIMAAAAALILRKRRK